MIKVYIATTGVFLPFPNEFFHTVRDDCHRLGLEPLIPFDNTIKPELRPIFNSNVALIQQCDYIVADVNAFRGTEPDSGVCFEVGMAFALGKKIYLHYLDDDTVLEKVSRFFGINDNPTVMPDGMVVENFNQPVNLMLACSGTLVHGTLFNALCLVKKSLSVK